ncbi:MAG: hypothetical protein H8D24_04800 [Gammaproteobacteria bacterium]|uniref:Uncharacterized protein n=1 Tax=Candidatus Thiopontia autotrophica TaxID=2841688 RepID=A0A8J6PAY3_9GAMM|nr:hypothetical protein [Candidatus Thiopontia autotrophica]MBL6968777.1 hypothetical protein [Gammaproteobacteria bacterium]
MNLPPNFSKAPGAWEQQLQRRWNNPLFSKESQQVVQHQVVGARELDKSEQKQFLHQFKKVVEKVSKLPERADTELLLELLPELDKCYTDCMVLGAPLPKERQALSRLITLFEQTLMRHAGTDNTFLEQLKQEQSARKIHHHALQNPIIAAMMRDESPISNHELPATILSAEPSMVEDVLAFLDQKQIRSLLEHATEIILSAEKDGATLPASALEVQELLNRATSSA